MRILDATEADVPSILTIYNDAVRNTTAIWNDIEVDLDDRFMWLRTRKANGFPVLVAKDTDDTVLGYASYGNWRSWDGYRHTVEHSIYVAARARGQGIGNDMLQALIARAAKSGTHVMVAGIEASNDASIRLHRGLGFREAGRLFEVGTKFGRWLDLVFLQLLLDQNACSDRVP